MHCWGRIMKFLFVFTGGTIGSAVSGDYISPDDNIPYELIETYRERYGLEHSYDIITPYTELSEQNTGDTISKLIACVCDAVADNTEDNSAQSSLADITEKNMESGEAKSYDGIIVTHGTDTLPYSAAALSYALGNDCIPVCLVSSNYPIADERANGVDNLHGAIRLMESAYEHGNGTPSGNEKQVDELAGIAVHRGVFVSYRNHDGMTYIHRASRLLETQAFSDEYYSVGGQYYGRIHDDRFVRNGLYREASDEITPFGKVEMTDTCHKIMRVRPYPGMSYMPMASDVNSSPQESIEKMLANMDVRCVIHESYHSGTINTKLPDYHAFFQAAAKKGIPVFLTGVSEGISYESTNVYEQLHIIPLYGIAPVAAYVKLWMIMSNTMTEVSGSLDIQSEDYPVILVDRLKASLGGDRFDN